MAIEQWEFFNVPHLLGHEASVYNGHLRGPVTLTSIAERLAVELSLPVMTTYDYRGWDSSTQPPACRANALTDCATGGRLFSEEGSRVQYTSQQLLRLVFKFEFANWKSCKNQTNKIKLEMSK